MEDPEFAITQLAQTTMRSELGKISLDKVFRERDSLNIFIVDAINKASEAWGIACLRYEIRKLLLFVFYLCYSSTPSKNLKSTEIFLFCHPFSIYYYYEKGNMETVIGKKFDFQLQFINLKIIW